MSTQDHLTIRQRQLVNKRLSLNLLIQGAAAHAHWSAHHVVANELNELHSDLMPTYDEMMIRSRLGYWIGGIPQIMGSPTRFWLRLEESKHEFVFHPFFSRHGYRLARSTKQEVLDRCKRAQIPIDALDNESRGMEVYHQAIFLEWDHQKSLEALAIQVCCEIYGIDEDLLLASLTEDPRFGVVRPPKTEAGKQILSFMIGWSAVVRDNNRLKVKAKATFWPLLIHELVKGTVELICLHGLNDLKDDEYEVVMDHTEHIEFEIPMLQIGSTVFQRFLAARPRELPLAECIARISKLEPAELDFFMDQLIEWPNRATAMIRARDSVT